jgi:hypothetical protein
MSFGLMPVIHILLGEIFPTDIRTTSIGLINALENIAFMVNIKLFPSFMASLGLPAIMYIYAGIRGAIHQLLSIILKLRILVL